MNREVPDMPKSEYKMHIWSNTLKGAKVYPLGRSDEEYIQQKFEEHLHSVMHRPGQEDF